MTEILRKDVPIQSSGGFIVKNKSGQTRKKFSGTLAREVAVAVFDTAGTDSSGAANTTIAAHGLGVYIPSKAIITKAWVDVVTTFTSATDAATIALKVQSANDLVAAIAISDASNVWDAGLHGALPGSYAEATVAGDTAVLDAARNA